MDKKLLERLINRDEQAFEQVYYETKNAVFAMIMSIVRNRDDAEDLMQDTYIKAIKKIHQYDPKYSFESWIITIARNLAIDHYRREKKTISVDIIDEEQFFFKADSTHPDFEYEALELLKILTSEEQQIVILKVIQNLKFKEIAEIMDKPLGTVLWTYHDSIKRMRKIYYNEEKDKEVSS